MENAANGNTPGVYRRGRGKTKISFACLREATHSHTYRCRRLTGILHIDIFWQYQSCPVVKLLLASAQWPVRSTVIVFFCSSFICCLLCFSIYFVVAILLLCYFRHFPRMSSSNVWLIVAQACVRFSIQVCIHICIFGFI